MTARPLSALDKVRLTARIWRLFLVVVTEVRKRPLPEVVSRLQQAPALPAVDRTPAHLGSIVYRVLHVGAFGPRCLYLALVLFRLLRGQGVAAELVIGLPADPTNHEAHAWVEIEGHDVGPPPGRSGHQELARYGGRAGVAGA